MTDRSELTRRYKETPRPMGVYRVRNKATGRWLVGSTRDVPGMLNRIRFELDMGSHRNRSLQEDWNASPADAFEFEALDLLEPSDDPSADLSEDLRELEQMWRERLAASDDAPYAE